MAYTAFETSAGAALDRLEALCKQYTSNGAFSAATQPTLTEVESFLTGRYYLLQGMLGAAGYELIPTDTEAKGILEQANVHGAALDVELTNPISATGESSTKGELLERMWRDDAKLINSYLLAKVGATRDAYVPIYGGVSISRKAVLADDSDAVQPVFKRRMFENPGVADAEDFDE